MSRGWAQGPNGSYIGPETGGPRISREGRIKEEQALTAVPYETYSIYTRLYQSTPRLVLHIKLRSTSLRWPITVGASSRPFVLSEEDEIIIEQLELGTVPFWNPRFRDSTSSSISVSFCQVTSQARQAKKNIGVDMPTHHDQRFFHATGDIA